MNKAARQHTEVTDYTQAIARAGSDAERTEQVAAWILHEFERFYAESRRLPAMAKDAFERRDHRAALGLAHLRLTLYNHSIDALGAALKQAFPRLAEHEALWRDVEAYCVPRIGGRYEADLAFAFINSARRKVYQGEWKPVEYAFGEARASLLPSRVYRTFDCRWPVAPELMKEILQIAHFATPFRDLEADAARVAARLNEVLGEEERGGLFAIDMVTAGFFRNRGCYLVGRLVLKERPYRPFVVALLNGPRGIHADAVLHEVADAHNLFSSTLATFHVTNRHYHELSAFLYSIMPQRPVGLHYSTVGFHHVAKVAVMDELKGELASTGEVLDTAPGFRGTVAIGFTAPGSAYILKVIRDRPTEGYKWGSYHGPDAVLAKYAWVHEIDRTGSMLDNILYYNLKLDRSWFAPHLLEEIASAAPNAVKVQGDAVVFRYLIAQRRLTPLPLFLAQASEADARQAVVSLGYCIKNNAAANIFNKDYDARNYGVSRYDKVYLYDYDALEPFTDIKIRTNLDRFEGEEDVPGWFFEEGDIFLPEEIEVGLRIRDRSLRRLFREVHGDLLTPEYWLRLQDSLRAGQVPAIRTYPESCDLPRMESGEDDDGTG